jgi:shikimate kinase
MLSAILIGPPGSGKSSVGKSLAQRMGVEFSDTDTIIEKKWNKSISDIFVESGEPYFREIERAVVLDRLVGVQCLISRRSQRYAITRHRLYFSMFP